MSTKATQAFIKLASLVTASIAVEVCKDGFQPADLLAFLKSPQFAGDVEEVIADLPGLPAELASAGPMYWVSLARDLYNAGTEIAAELHACHTSPSAA